MREGERGTEGTLPGVGGAVPAAAPANAEAQKAAHASTIAAGGGAPPNVATHAAPPNVAAGGLPPNVAAGGPAPNVAGGPQSNVATKGALLETLLAPGAAAKPTGETQATGATDKAKGDTLPAN